MKRDLGTPGIVLFVLGCLVLGTAGDIRQRVCQSAAGGLMIAVGIAMCMLDYFDRRC